MVLRITDNGLQEVAHVGGWLDWLNPMTGAANMAVDYANRQINDPTHQAEVVGAQKVLQLMAGKVPEPALTYTAYQTRHETGNYTNAGWKQYNNASGIMYAGQKNARRGPNGYAIFNTFEDWANAYAHELNKGAYPPAKAKSLEDFNNRLHANHYYTASTTAYLEGMKRAQNALRASGPSAAAGQDIIVTPGNATSSDINWNPATWPTWGKVAGGAAAVLILVKVLK
jgi:hypothetical protein